ncbi:hypothetical protein FRB94_008824 [Tulasnella sp. JGI-2019a]|nr:hypothetical protein FRB93_012913 [Tulasnella sp. JGI-2019a]KAG9011225.1 hypothetical protein FRB94_008824 [Tulasnella sp. JGI-2019a]
MNNANPNHLPPSGVSSSLATPNNIIQIPTPSNASLRTSPAKAHFRTYDSKLIGREMDRLGATHPAQPQHSHSHSHSHTGTPLGSHVHGMSAAGSVSTLSLALGPTLAHAAPSLAGAASMANASDDPWSVLHVHVLPLFNGEPLRMPIEDVNALVKRHIQTVVSKSPSRAINTLEADVVDLLATGMITLNAKLTGLEDEPLLIRVVELWSFFWGQILPYIEGVFLPFQTDQLLVSLSKTPKVNRSASPTGPSDAETSPGGRHLNLSSAPIDVRTLTLQSFRDAILLPVFERLHALLAFSIVKDSKRDYNQPRFQQMLLVLTSIQPTSYALSMSEVPPSPGEHAIIHLLRAVRNPHSSAFHPLQMGRQRPRTMGPSSFSGGAPRDRRGRIARKDDAATTYSSALMSDSERGGADETPTISGVGMNPETYQQAQRLREEREFLDSLKSPDIERSMEAEALSGNAYHNGLVGDNDPGRFANTALAVSYDSANDLSEEEDFGTEISRTLGDWENRPPR